MTFKYICGVDYQHEMEEGKADLFDSAQELMTAKRCWKQCGIVRILLDQEGNVARHKWVVAQDLFGPIGDSTEPYVKSDPKQIEESDQ